MDQEGETDQALGVYQRLVDFSPERFKTEALSKWRDLTYPGRTAAVRAKEIQQERDQVQSFYADLNRLVNPKPAPAAKPTAEAPKP